MVADNDFSGGPELHNGDSDLPCCRNAHDVGILWYVVAQVAHNIRY